MLNEWFVLFLMIASTVMLFFGFRILPREGWQILATLPIRPLGNGQWLGVNLTWYGLLTANAYLVALSILIVLLGAATVPLAGVILLALLLLGVCIPASRLVARIVEGKAHTFTVGGAVFVGIVVAPWLILLINKWVGYQLPVCTTLAAISIAYAFGEGLGRLACISFGCCYGKALNQCSSRVRRLFKNLNFTFCEETRKISYASDLEGEPTFPVQAITAILFVGTGLVGLYMYLQGEAGTVYVLIILVTQGWRVLSETLRADYRGGRRISVYQLMGMMAIPYAVLTAIKFSGAVSGPMQLQLGFQYFWQPGILLFLQAAWVLLFIYTGRSTVTGANLSFHVHHDRI